MKKRDYLLQAIRHKLYTKTAWLVSAFSITKESTGSSYPYQLIPQPWGYNFINENGEVEKIDDGQPNTPLFTFKDPITVNEQWIGNVQGELQTNIGNLMFNLICIISSFGNKYPFVTGKVTVGAIEDKVAVKLLDTPEDDSQRRPDAYYVDEYVRFVDSLQFISSLSQLTTLSATPKTIVAPPGIKEFKQQLLKKYAGKLSDPVELAKFEGELKAFDEKYLADDPSNGTFVSGKIKNIARKKMFLALGGEEGFDDKLDLVPITNSLDEGWPRDPVQYTAMMNSLRAGSYARGSDTVKGGVSAKYLLRAANNYTIEDGDCGSKLGIHRNFDEKQVEQLIGRYVFQGTRWVLVENKEQAQNYVSKSVIVRSPMYCKLEGERICKVCAGHKLAKFPTGLTIPLTEISSILLDAFMKKMHGKVLSTAKLKINQAFS